MRLFLELLEAGFGAVFSSIGRVITAVLVGIGCFAGFLLHSSRLNLTAEPGTFFLALGAWFTLWLGTVLFPVGKVGKALVTISLVCLTIITVRHYMPGTAAGVGEVAHYQDFRNFVRAKDAVTEIQAAFVCNSVNWKSLTFFGRDGNTNERVPLIWIDRTDQGLIDCYRGPGVDPLFGRTLQPATDAAVRQIAAQMPPATPMPPEPPLTVVTVHAMPVMPEPSPSPTPATEVAWSEGTIPPHLPPQK